LVVAKSEGGSAGVAKKQMSVVCVKIVREKFGRKKDFVEKILRVFKFLLL
jgi:hypothetical protein